jgi:hypothetical protein
MSCTDIVKAYNGTSNPLNTNIACDDLSTYSRICASPYISQDIGSSCYILQQKIKSQSSFIYNTIQKQSNPVDVFPAVWETTPREPSSQTIWQGLVMSRANGQYGLAYSDTELISTQDYGAHWWSVSSQGLQWSIDPSSIPLNNQSLGITQVMMNDSGSIQIIIQQGMLLLSMDSGQTWTNQALSLTAISKVCWQITYPSSSSSSQTITSAQTSLWIIDLNQGLYSYILPTPTTTTGILTPLTVTNTSSRISWPSKASAIRHLSKVYANSTFIILLYDDGALVYIRLSNMVMYDDVSLYNFVDIHTSQDPTSSSSIVLWFIIRQDLVNSGTTILQVSSLLDDDEPNQKITRNLTTLTQVSQNLNISSYIDGNENLIIYRHDVRLGHSLSITPTPVNSSIINQQTISYLTSLFLTYATTLITYSVHDNCIITIDAQSEIQGKTMLIRKYSINQSKIIPLVTYQDTRLFSPATFNWWYFFQFDSNKIILKSDGSIFVNDIFQTTSGDSNRIIVGQNSLIIATTIYKPSPLLGKYLFRRQDTKLGVYVNIVHSSDYADYSSNDGGLGWKVVQNYCTNVTASNDPRCACVALSLAGTQQDAMCVAPECMQSRLAGSSLDDNIIYRTINDNCHNDLSICSAHFTLANGSADPNIIQNCGSGTIAPRICNVCDPTSEVYQNGSCFKTCPTSTSICPTGTRCINGICFPTSTKQTISTVQIIELVVLTFALLVSMWMFYKLRRQSMISINKLHK